MILGYIKHVKAKKIMHETVANGIVEISNRIEKKTGILIDKLQNGGGEAIIEGFKIK